MKKMLLEAILKAGWGEARGSNALHSQDSLTTSKCLRVWPEHRITDLKIYPMFASHPFIQQIYSECLPCVRRCFICWEYSSENARSLLSGKTCKGTISRGYKPQRGQKPRGEKVNRCPMGFGTLGCGPARDRTALHLLHLEDMAWARQI